MRSLKAVFIGLAIGFVVILSVYWLMRTAYHDENYDKYCLLIKDQAFKEIAADVANGKKSQNEIQKYFKDIGLRFNQFDGLSYGIEGLDIKAVYEFGGADHHYGIVISKGKASSSHWKTLRNISDDLYSYDE